MKVQDNFFSFLDHLGLVWRYAVNGLVGGFIWSVYKKSKFLESFRQILTGGVVSGYFTPVIVQKTHMDLSMIGFTSFIIGMLGMVIIDTIYKYCEGLLKKWKEAIIIINTKNSDD